MGGDNPEVEKTDRAIKKDHRVAKQTPQDASMRSRSTNTQVDKETDEKRGRDATMSTRVTHEIP